jgi:AcrR family transcriptional regulator
MMRILSSETSAARADQVRKTSSGGRPTREEAAKRSRRLLDIAQRHFLADGYLATSLDDVAREAGVAKKTLYVHYGSKTGLFTAIVERIRDKWISELRGIVLLSTSPEQVLQAVALHLLDVGTHPEMIALYRLFLAESRRFPDLIRSNYDARGVPRGMEPLLSYLRKAVAEGTLKVDDVALATEQFTSLVLAGIRERVLANAARRPSAHERNRIARQAVHLFLRGCK